MPTSTPVPPTPHEEVPWRGGTSHQRYAQHDFLRWNDALAQRFFRREYAGRPVWITVPESLVIDLARDLGVERDSWIRALKQGPQWESRSGGLCRQAEAAHTSWRARRFPYPPYLGYLCLFSLAAATETGDRANAYYSRLRTLLGETPRAGMLAGFAGMALLWKDLEEWSCGDMKGQLGEFRAGIVGHQDHIGYPLAQQLLTPLERTHLPRVFEDAKLHEEHGPGDRLRDALLEFGGRVLQRGTLDLLRTGSGTDVLTLLTQVSDIHRWWLDVGRFREAAARASTLPARPALRLSFLVDKVAGTASSTLRLRLPLVPPDGLRLLTPAGPALARPSSVEGWTTAVLRPDGQPLAAPQLGVWLDGLQLEAADGTDRYRLAAGAVRPLGVVPGLPGLVELQAPEAPDGTFLVHRSAAAHFAEVAERNGAVQQIADLDDLPDGWSLVDLVGLRDADELTHLLPKRPQRPTVRLAPIGGLTSDPGSRQYFTFAPPQLRLTGIDRPVLVVVQGVEVLVNAPGDVPLPEARPGLAVAVAWAGDEPLAECRVELNDGRPWTAFPKARRQRAQGPGIQRDPLLAHGLELPPPHGSVLVGKTPGQVVSAASSSEWPPIWLLSPGRPPVYCGGGSLERDTPTGVVGAHLNVSRRWRELFVGNRPDPVSPGTKALWNAYWASAHDVLESLPPVSRSIGRPRTARLMAPGRSAGERLLWILTGWETTSRDRFVRALAHVVAPGANGPYDEHTAREWLVALGHCAQTNELGVQVQAPQIVELPGAGSPVAVLCGARGPGTLQQLEDAAASCGVEVVAEGQAEHWAPDRIQLLADDRDQLREVAQRLGVRHQGYPVAFAELEQAPSLDEVLAQLSWSQRSEPSWPRRDFDVDRASFVPGRGPGGQANRLSEYTNPLDQQRVHLLWRGPEAAEIDRAWGRLAAFQDAGRSPLSFDSATRTASWPWTSPLPPGLHTAMVLSSGWAPVAEADGRRRYTGVTVEMYERLRLKTGSTS